MSKTNIFIIILVVILVIIVGVYFYNAGNQTPAGSSLFTQSAQDSNIGAQELALRRQVESIKIDPKFFTSQVFSSLVDNTQEIPPQNVGRENPFAPVPGVPSPFATQSSAASQSAVSSQNGATAQQ